MENLGQMSNTGIANLCTMIYGSMNFVNSVWQEDNKLKFRIYQQNNGRTTMLTEQRHNLKDMNRRQQ